MPIHEATAADRSAVVAMLSRAFADDPALSYVFPDPAVRAARLPKLFRLLFDSDSAGMRLVSGDAQAVTMWRPPGVAEVGWLEMLGQLIPLLGTFGTAAGRAMRVGDAIEAHFPHEPFWYLHIAGVDPAQQGRGLGGASIREGLARAAKDGLPAYLETATASNVGLYQSLGFELVSEWQVPKAGPTFWSMRRPID